MGEFKVTPAPSPMGETLGLNDPVSYSGAVVARMILKSLGLAAPLPKDQMYTYAAGNNAPGENWPGWYIDPLGMQHALADHDPRALGFPGAWRIYANPGQPAADNQVRNTLKNFNVAASALLYGGQHWVCVYGYGFDDGTDALTGFFYLDPAYGTQADNFSAVAAWDPAFSPVGGGVQWVNQIVEVGDPNPAGEMPPIAQRRIKRPGDTIVPPEDAVRLALEGASELGGMDYLRRAISAGRPGRPRLVARLDRRGQYYYLVPIDVEQEATLAIIMVDARYGDLLGATASEEPHRPWSAGLDEERTIELVTRTPIPLFEPVDVAVDRLVTAVSRDGADLRVTARAAFGSFRQPRDHVILRPDEFDVGKVWVWQPCESISPYYPYQQIRTVWNNVYVNVHSGAVRTYWDQCESVPLGA